MEKNYEIITFKDGEFSLDVKADFAKDTVWLTKDEISKLFDRDRSVITRHINNIYEDHELDQKSTCAKNAHIPLTRNRKYESEIYNLDVIISVGYRVKSNRGVMFRQWANSVLKDYLIKGYAVNEKRMINLNKTINIETRMLATKFDIQTEELSYVIDQYTRALNLLDDYDHQCVKPVKGKQATYVITYDECRKLINSMKFGNSSDVFGVEKEEGKLNGIIAAVYQNVFGEEVYKSLESKAAHLLYFLVKDHPFVDGCKRIAATIFLQFLNKNNNLFRDGKMIISNEALTAITLLTAESNPDEMEIVVQVIENMLA